MFYAYVIRSHEGFLYVGSTSDMDKCLERHNAGLTFQTKHDSDWEVVYSEPFGARKEATEREQWLRTEAGAEFIERLLKQRSTPKP